MLILSQSFPEISFLASSAPASLADYIGHKGRWQPHYLCHESLLHTWWHLARCQASDGFALLLHSHPCPSARFTEVHNVMYGIEFVTFVADRSSRECKPLHSHGRNGHGSVGVGREDTGTGVSRATGLGKKARHPEKGSSSTHTYIHT